MERGALTLTGFLVSLPDTVAKPVFETPAGRTVFGGGGIVPDVLVLADTLTSREREALRELDRTGGRFVNTVFSFAVEYLQKNPDPGTAFHLAPSDLVRFHEMLRASGAELSEDGFRESERFILFQLEKEIALRAGGAEGEFQRVLPRDRILQQALGLLKDSPSRAELLDLGADPGRSDWIPVVKEEEEAASGSLEAGEEEPGDGNARLEGKDGGVEQAPGSRRAPGAGKLASDGRASGPEQVVGAWRLP
jgi:hypothetical protein